MMAWTGVETAFSVGIVLSIICGFLIGAERETRGKDAGISTHVLVIAGATVFTLMSRIVDPMSTSRIAAQIITGVGFLGAGLILKEGHSVRNLTTAASIWFAAAIGMSFGFGYYIVGVLATFVAIIAPRIPHFKKKDPDIIIVNNGNGK